MKRNAQNFDRTFAGAATLPAPIAKTTKRSLNLMLCMLAALFALTLVPPVWAQPDVDLYDFNVAPDSENSTATLLADKFGNLYGTAAKGGLFGFGTVFVMCAPNAAAPDIAPCVPAAPLWTENVLYNFVGGADGANPHSTLIFGGNYAGRAFTLYGTTYNGGNPNTCGGTGCGTVFELCAPVASGGCGGAGWVENVLHRFLGVKDGAHPFAGVITDKANNLYGTTVYGGAKGVCASGGVNLFCGTVFKMHHNNVWLFAEAVIHRFGGAPGDGANPYSALCCNTINGIATLYGTTLIGGAANAGTVFKVANIAGYPEAILYNFCSVVGCTDGANPYADVIFDANGQMYGTTFSGGILGGCGGAGCGTVFRLAALPVPLYSFLGSPDGANPTAGPMLSAGVLYGTTYEGGIPASCGGPGCGTVYQFALPAGPEIVRYPFTGSAILPFDGAHPYGGVILDPPVAGGQLYGTTHDAGRWGFGIAYSE
ncbi:MAG: choice-of-anchor tandem repeat GloVer-containing protein [Terriglobales bacterium]